VDKVVLVSGAARGLGLVQAEALLEAGAIGIHTFDINPPPPSTQLSLKISTRGLIWKMDC
jgi:NAD(P)-dependent dehydrogenase (short-subunit alcohol dehydrogenase family)